MAAHLGAVEGADALRRRVVAHVERHVGRVLERVREDGVPGKNPKVGLVLVLAPGPTIGSRWHGPSLRPSLVFYE